jgi:phage N-6-adenine-methyltransferase
MNSTEQTHLKVHFSSQKIEWATPQALFDDLDAEFGFEVDVCATDATDANAKCAAFFTKDDDGLKQKWTGVCWMNPPYGRAIQNWIRKAYESAQQGATVVCLVPARTDTKWWNRYCVHGQIRFLEGRLKFNDGTTPAPFPSAVVVFYPPVKSRYKWTTMVATARSTAETPQAIEAAAPVAKFDVGGKQ